MLDDGRTLVHCFASCDVADVVAALGLTFSDLMPVRSAHHFFKPKRQFLDSRQVLGGVSHEVAVLAVIAEDLAAGQPITEPLRDRLFRAARRLSVALQTVPVVRVPAELKIIRRGEGAL